jgi:hypothetical protein
MISAFGIVSGAAWLGVSSAFAASTIAPRNAGEICSDAKRRSIRSAATIRLSAILASSGRFNRWAAMAMYAWAIS